MCIDAVELGGLNQGKDDGGGFAATLGPHEHVVFVAYGDAAPGPFGCVIVQLQKAVLDGGVSNVAALNRIGSRDFQLSQQAGPDLVWAGLPAGVLPLVGGLKSHNAHQATHAVSPC